MKLDITIHIHCQGVKLVVMNFLASGDWVSVVVLVPF
jgi:hypothetical protein